MKEPDEGFPHAAKIEPVVQEWELQSSLSWLSNSQRLNCGMCGCTVRFNLHLLYIFLGKWKISAASY